MTTQACGVKGDNNHTVQLTKRQVRDVQRVFDDLKNRMSTAVSMEETQRIFNDTIVSLSRYNLLPTGMSIELAKRLVTRASQNQKLETFLTKISTRVQADLKEGTIQNSFCYVAGNTSNTHFAKPVTKLTMHLYDIMDYSSGNHILVLLSTALWIVFNPLSTISQMILQRQGNHCGVSIFFGNYHYYPYPNWLSPAQGWISTNGINGKQNITGSFWGQKVTSGWQPQDDWYMNYTWRGCIGFTGFITYVGSDSAYYLGSAFHVNVGPNRP
ncbi:MAG: hypothetical protein NTZ75_02885 [Euryarchaeota archaeon]|nr:hypothetical protein [Euryarchaeota archaeon]